MTTTTKIRLLKFGGGSCPACRAMERAGTLDRFASDNPDVPVHRLDVYDDRGEAAPGSIYEAANTVSDTYEVRALPTIIIETLDGRELAREEGGLNGPQLRSMLKRARENLEEVDEERAAAAAVTAWIARGGK